MKMIIVLTVFSFFSSKPLYSQDIFEREKRDHIWLVGSSPIVAGEDDITRIDFNLEHPVVEGIDLNMKFVETNASICDASGNLLLCTNGIEIRNFNNDTLATNLALTPLSEDWVDIGYVNVQGALILPLPESDSLYYIFYEDTDWAPFGGAWVQNLFYAKINMSANAGSGLALERDVSIINDTLAFGRIIATRHANGRDWWILIPEWDNNRYYSILFTSDGIEAIKTIEIGEPILTGGFQSSFSPDGKKYARVDIKYTGESEHRVSIYDFNRCTGEFTSYTSFSFVDWAFAGGGIVFSENSRFLYVIAWTNIYQYDLNVSNVESSMIKVAEYDGFVAQAYNQSTTFHTGQLAPNGKIYVNCASNANYFHIIQKPNLKGLACNVQQHILEIPTLNFKSISNFPYYGLGPLDGSPCDTLGIDNPPPQAAFSYVIEDSSAFQVAFYNGALFSPESWFWEFGDGQSSAERFPVHTYAEAGVYEVCLTASNQTGSDTFCDTVRFGVSSLLPVDGSGAAVRLFPNPASDIVTLSAQGLPAGVREVELVLYDALGREALRQGVAVRNGEFLQRIGLAGLPPGLYFWELKAAFGEELGVGKIVKR